MTPNSGIDVSLSHASLGILCLLLGLPSPALMMEVFALSYLIMFCHAWLLSLGGLLLLKGNRGGVNLGEKGDCGELEGSYLVQQGSHKS